MTALIARPIPGQVPKSEPSAGTRQTAAPCTEQDFARIAAFAHREFGLHLPPTKINHVRSRLIRVLEQTGHDDFSEFCARLERNPHGAERRALVSALTTNVTQFFREDHHFRVLADTLIKPRLAEIRNGQRLRIWSAGCSAGQEALSAAMTIKALLPEADRLNIRILGTDIDPNIVADARRGEYAIDEMQGIPPAYRAMAQKNGDGSTFRIAPEISRMIRFAELNLIEDWPIKGPFDAILCRNVAIYFDKPTQARLWSRFADLLSPDGLLMIGHSERVAGPALERLTSAGITTYRPSAAAPH